MAKHSAAAVKLTGTQFREEEKKKKNTGDLTRQGNSLCQDHNKDSILFRSAA
jgi:hypothetical protein